MGNARIVAHKLKGFAELGEDEFELAFNKIVFDSLGNLVELTPQDTGFAANSWYITKSPNVPPVIPSKLSRTNRLAALPQAISRKEASKSQKVKIGGKISIMNWVPYIGVLEDGDKGNDKRIPHKMVAKTAQKIRAQYGGAV